MMDKKTESSPDEQKPGNGMDYHARDDEEQTGWDGDEGDDYGYGDDSDDDEPEEDEFERAMDECGQMPGGGCHLAGTEYCDWDCPFSAQMWKNVNQLRDEKGRFKKR